MPSRPRDRPSPIYYDLVQGRGGIAGGVFDVRGTDSLDATTGGYVKAWYIEGQDFYVGPS